MSNAIFVLSAPSGTGKTSLASELLKKINNLRLSISHTTRAPRKKEEAQKNYHFVSVTDFLKMRDQGEFIENAEVFGNYYGTSHRQINDILENGQDVLLEIDWQGAVQIKQHYPNAVMIFVLPPNIETLRSRLEKRAADAPEVIAHRLKQALSEMKQYIKFDYLIVNEDFERALEELVIIVRSRRLSRPHRQKTLHKLLTELRLA